MGEGISTAYRRLGMPAAYVRVRGFDRIQQESMVLEYVAAHGRVARREVVELCGVGPDQANWLLQRLTRDGKLVMHGAKRWSFYTAP